jgi:D-apionolactonase
VSNPIQSYGSAFPLSKPVALRAGPVTMIFEPESAFLRYIKVGDREILRGIYVAVRDHNWGTVPVRVEDLSLNETPGGFESTFKASCRAGAVDFGWKGCLTGDAAGRIIYTMDGQALSTFLRNRIGFCVLHAASACSGEPCVIEKTDGSHQDGQFPGLISPHQPFLGMRAITHEIAPGTKVRVAFDGDVFEMEDQRNWTDASYKTYCTPLQLPFPVEMKPGDRVRQSVTLSFGGISQPARGKANTRRSYLVPAAARR